MIFDLNRGPEKQRPGCRILTSPQDSTGRVEGGLPLNLSEVRISQKTLSGKTMGIGKGYGGVLSGRVGNKKGCNQLTINKRTHINRHIPI